MILKLIQKYGSVICALAVFIASWGVNACRGGYFQPQEPENIDDFIRKHRSL